MYVVWVDIHCKFPSLPSISHNSHVLSSFPFSDIYWKHRPKHSCWEPTVDTSNRPVCPPIPLDLAALGPVHADGSSGMPIYLRVAVVAPATCVSSMFPTRILNNNCIRCKWEISLTCNLREKQMMIDVVGYHTKNTVNSFRFTSCMCFFYILRRYYSKGLRKSFIRHI